MSSTLELPTRVPLDEEDDVLVNMNIEDWPSELVEGFFLNQTTSQCCRCCCLQPNINWKIYPYKVGK